MKRHCKKILLPIGVVTAVFISAVVFFLSQEEETIPEGELSYPVDESEYPYPLLEPNEKLYDVSSGWYRAPGRKLVFEFDGPFPKMPDKMLLYKIIRPKNVTEAYVRELAQKNFDMPTDAVFRRNGPYYKLKTETYILQFDSATGFFNIFKYRKAREKLSEDRKDYPSDEECRRIATEYLKGRNLLPEDAYLSSVTDVNIESVGAISLWFGRKIGKYECWGPGSEILVEVGVEGEITKVSIRWVEYEPYKLAPIKTSKEAFEQLKHGNAFIAGSGKVTKIALAYHTPAMGDYIQPMYNFAFTRPGAVASVPAIRSEYLKSKEEMRKELEEKTTSPGK
jgi:hypothetical protein